MSKMKIVDLKQRSEAWLQWRAQGITASDIPVILGLNPDKTSWQLWAEKVGRINRPDISNNPNVIRGVRLEDSARQVAENRYDDILFPICGECAQWNTLRASFDGLDSACIPYEFKAPCDAVWQELEKNGTDSKTYRLYEAQVHAQCLVAGSMAGRLIFYHEDGRDLDFFVSLTMELEQKIMALAKSFHTAVITHTPPEPDPERDWYLPGSGEDKFKWGGYADVWRSQQQRIQVLKEELNVLEQEQKGIQEVQIALMGSYRHADIGGVKVTRFIKKGSIDYASFLRDKFPSEDVSAELESYRKSSREESRFSWSKDELVNAVVDEIVTPVKTAYF